MPTKFLTRSDLEEITGLKVFDTLEDLEILFNGFNEIDSLIGMPRLKRLCCIDNGITRISNLQPVSNTLLILNLSDQEITKIENLNLPYLRELYLHRNLICSMDGLQGCPRLKKLWLCQNQITTIGNLHSVPELEELWLQTNLISSLQGLECCQRLVSLQIAGNLISDFAELRRLANLPVLSKVSFQDIHFGRCPITDSEGYKEFILCHLKQISHLDGVLVSQQASQVSKQTLIDEVRSFNEMIGEIEAEHRLELQNITAKQQARTSHSSVLENELHDALCELEKLVMDGKSTINQQVKRQQEILQSNIIDLQKNIDSIYQSAVNRVHHSINHTTSQYDTTESLFYILELLYTCIDTIIGILCEAANSPPIKGIGRVIQHPISDNTPDYQNMSSIISQTKGSNTSRNIDSDGNVPSLSLIKLFRIFYATKSVLKDDNSSTEDVSYSTISRVFTVVKVDQLKQIVYEGFNSIHDTIIFSTNPSVITSLYLAESGSSFQTLLFEDLSMKYLDERSQNENLSFLQPILKEDEMHSLKQAKNIKPLILLSCELNLKRSGIIKYFETLATRSRLRLPSTESSKRDMLIEMKKARKVMGVELEQNRGWLYVLPNGECRSKNMDENESNTILNSSLLLDYICFCTTPIIDGGIKSIEQQLEVLTAPVLSPTDCLDPQNQIENNLLANYDIDIHNEVQKYVHQVLEELETNEANTFRLADAEVLAKEALLKGLRDDLLNEKKIQDNMLRDMRNNHQQATAGGNSNTNSSTSNHHQSSQNPGKSQRR